jgi:hypothetical protein
LRRLAALATSSALLAIGCGASEVASIGFGTGGVDCELDSIGSTFPAGATVRMVATISPLPSTVTITTTKDGDPMQDPATVQLDGSVPCAYGSLPDLEPGHYQVVVAIPGSQVPPLTGEFDVTP